MTDEMNLNEIKIQRLNHGEIILKNDGDVVYKTYPGEFIINNIIDLMKDELSEPYPIFTYRYFLNDYPNCCIMTYIRDKFVGCIIGKCAKSKKGKMKGYIAMIAVEKQFRGMKIGRTLVELFISQCKNVYSAHEVYLETESINLLALGLYESLGFTRTKKLFNYYLNGNSAFRLKLWVNEFCDEKNN